MFTTLTSIRDAIATFRRSPAALLYAVVGGTLTAGVVHVAITAYPVLLLAAGRNPAVVVSSARYRLGVGFVVTALYVGTVLLVGMALWVGTRAAVIHAIGSRLRAERRSSVTSIAAVWRPLLRWAFLRWLSLGFVEAYLPWLGRRARTAVADTTSYAEWRRRTTFLPQALVLEPGADLESAAAESSSRVDAATDVPRIFLSILPFVAGLAVVSFLGLVFYALEYDSDLLGTLGAVSIPVVLVGGVIAAAMLDLAVRTRCYVALDDAQADRGRRRDESAAGDAEWITE